MSDLTDPTEPHPVPTPNPEEAPAPIPPEVVEHTHGVPPTEPAPRQESRPTGRSGARVLVALGFLLLFGAVAWEYLRAQTAADRIDGIERAQAGDRDELNGLLRSLQSEVDSRMRLRDDVDTLKAARTQTATPARPVDLGPIEARLKDVERRIAGLASTPQAAAPASAPSDFDARLNDLTRKVASLAAAPKPASDAPAAAPPAPAIDLGPIEARLKTLENKPAPAPAATPAPDVALLARVNAIADQLDGLGRKLADAQTQAEAAQTSAQAAQARATSILNRAAAAVALDAGKPLGPIPHAPPALARFAVDPPPTEASLRLSYDEAAQRAQDASVPPTAGKKFGARMLTRIESLVTVSQGDHVLVGPPAATILAGAHEKLQAGDLPGAVSTLDGLDPAARAAMAGWIGRAQSLLEARAALQSNQFGAP